MCVCVASFYAGVNPTSARLLRDVMHRNAPDRRSLCEESLQHGFVQSYVDFFYLTHRPDPYGENRVSKKTFAEANTRRAKLCRSAMEQRGGANDEDGDEGGSAEIIRDIPRPNDRPRFRILVGFSRLGETVSGFKRWKTCCGEPT